MRKYYFYCSQAQSVMQKVRKCYLASNSIIAPPGNYSVLFCPLALGDCTGFRWNLWDDRDMIAAPCGEKALRLTIEGGRIERRPPAVRAGALQVGSERGMMRRTRVLRRVMMDWSCDSKIQPEVARKVLSILGIHYRAPHRRRGPHQY